MSEMKDLKRRREGDEAVMWVRNYAGELPTVWVKNDAGGTRSVST